MFGKFGELNYERIDIDPIPEELVRLCEEVKTAKTAERLIERYKEFDIFLRRLHTMCSICYVRHTIDTRDEFYADEQKYYDEKSPAVNELIMSTSRSLIDSPFRKQLEAEIGELALKNIEINARTIGP